jgi:hypothetical protein
MASNKGEKKAKEPKPPKRASAEKYEILEIHRTQINNAPYNPRQISDKARKMLQKNLATVGLLSPIVWNQRTGNIVAGHQRIDAMDKRLSGLMIMCCECPLLIWTRRPRKSKTSS